MRISDWRSDVCSSDLEGWLDAVGGQPTTGFLAIIHRKRDLDQRIGQTFHEGKVVGRNEKLDRLQPMLLNPSLDNVGRDIAEAHSEAEQILEQIGRAHV